MKPLYCVNITSIAFIGMLFSVGVAETTDQAMTTSMYPTSGIEIHNGFIIRTYNNSCECFKYDCGCCQHLQWDAVSMDGKLCLNVSYLEKDFGISLMVTFNDFTIFNETVSARNPPPICFGYNFTTTNLSFLDNFIDFRLIDVEVCLHIYDIYIDMQHNNFHICFDFLGKIMKLTVTKIRLVCTQIPINPKLYQILYIKNKLSLLFPKKPKKDILPGIIML